MLENRCAPPHRALRPSSSRALHCTPRMPSPPRARPSPVSRPASRPASHALLATRQPRRRLDEHRRDGQGRRPQAAADTGQRARHPGTQPG
eukprot:scaffold9231_cov28-Phaeocystis_antarctica.AAC.1